LHTSEETCNVSLMSERRATQVVAANTVATMKTRNATAEMISQATDIDLPHLIERLNGNESFDMLELAHVGGFLHVNPGTLLKGVAA